MIGPTRRGHEPGRPLRARRAPEPADQSRKVKSGRHDADQREPRGTEEPTQRGFIEVGEVLVGHDAPGIPPQAARESAEIGSCQQEAATWPQETKRCGEVAARISKVLEHLDHEDGVERLRSERSIEQRSVV